MRVQNKKTIGAPAFRVRNKKTNGAPFRVQNKKRTGRRPSSQRPVRMIPQDESILARLVRLVLVCRFFLLRRFILLLALLLLFLLEPLLILFVFLLELLQLLLVFLFDLLLALRVGIFLRQLLAFLNLLLLDPLALLILFRTELLEFLLMLLLELRIHIVGIVRIVRPHRGRTVVVGLRIAGIRRRINWFGDRAGLRRVVRGDGSIRIALWRDRRIRIVYRAWPVGISLRRTLSVPLRVLRRSRLNGRRDLNVGMCHLSAFRLHLPDLRDCGRPAAVGLNDLFLFNEGRWRRRWRLLRYDRSVRHDSGRLYSRLSAGAENAALLWGNRRRHRRDGSRGDFLRVHADHVVVNRLS